MKFVKLTFFTIIFLLCTSGLCQVKQSTTVQNAVTGDSARSKEKRVTVKISTGAFPKSTTFKSVEKLAEKSPKLICPGKDASRAFLSLPCKVTKECLQLGNKNMLCCNNRCQKGIPAPPPEPTHSPTLFGLVERVCAVEMIPELFEIKRCTTDADCSPRICCPEKMLDGETVGYCRTAEPKLDNIPGVRQLIEPLKLMMSYMQCTPPPPPFLDVFPKPCGNSLDCFPNLCCQEKGKKYCRPPKRSLLTLLTTIAQRIVPADAARDFITRITT